MILSRKIASALATAAMAMSISSSSISVAAFSARVGIVSSASIQSSSYTTLRAATLGGGVDTDTVLPDFSTKEEYVSYMKAAGKLPSGFAVGTATGNFVSVEAPALGKLPIKATVIHLTEGPTDSWAAVFTSNKVCMMYYC